MAGMRDVIPRDLLGLLLIRLTQLSGSHRADVIVVADSDSMIESRTWPTCSLASDTCPHHSTNSKRCRERPARRRRESLSGGGQPLPACVVSWIREPGTDRTAQSKQLAASEAVVDSSHSAARPRLSPFPDHLYPAILRLAVRGAYRGKTRYRQRPRNFDNPARHAVPPEFDDSLAPPNQPPEPRTERTARPSIRQFHDPPSASPLRPHEP